MMSCCKEKLEFNMKRIQPYIAEKVMKWAFCKSETIKTLWSNQIILLAEIYRTRLALEVYQGR